VADAQNGLTACRACGAAALSHRYTVDLFDLLTCQRCSSMTTDYQMTSTAAGAFYDEGYYRAGDYVDYVGCAPFIKRNFRRFSRRLSQTHRGGRLLEVGCAYGFFLEVAAAAWDVYGIDVSAAAVAGCSPTLTGRVTCGDLLTYPTPTQRFDWVVAWDTIEHLENPIAYTKRFWEMLNPGGHVALTTGDVGSIVARMQGRSWRLLTPPSHLTFFSRTGMQQLLNRAGFCDVKITTTGYSRSWDFMLYRLLSPPAYNTLRSRYARLYDYVAARGLYLNLHDIMFVTARKPIAPAKR
jgi:SAM-dependent methyltransferase